MTSNDSTINTDMNDDLTTNNNNNQEEHPNFLIAHYTLLVVTSILGSAVLVVVSFWLREWCYDTFGIEFCSGSVSTARMREIRRFQLRALQLQRQMERDLLESSADKQQERKEIYGAFLQKFCKVSKDAMPKQVSYELKASC